MSAYRPLGPFPQFLLADGTVNNGGLINFYQTDLTTLQDTWSDMGLTTLNSNPVVLDASGRPTTDIWGSAAYGVVITDSLGANPRTFNNIQPESGGGSTIPALVNGDFLTNNGSVLLWQAISQLPDPTGFSGDVLFTDGTLTYWGALPVSPTSPIVNTGTSVKIGTMLIQTGSGSAPGSGFLTTAVAITFPVPFITTLIVDVIPTTVTAAPEGQIPVPAIISKSTTGFSVQFNSDDYGRTGAQFVNPITFDWVAYGIVAA